MYQYSYQCVWYRRPICYSFKTHVFLSIHLNTTVFKWGDSSLKGHEQVSSLPYFISVSSRETRFSDCFNSWTASQMLYSSYSEMWCFHDSRGEPYKPTLPLLASPALASGSRRIGTAWWRSAGRRLTSSGSCAWQSGTPRRQSVPFGFSHSQTLWSGGPYHSWGERKERRKETEK